MTRKKTSKPWQIRSPEVDAALNKVFVTSLQVACICMHDVPDDDGRVSPRTILLSQAMTWLLYRIHPNDLRDLYFGKNGVATWGYKPLPDDIEFQGPSFADVWKAFEGAPAISPVDVFADPATA